VSVVVSDTSPIRALAHLGRIELLHLLFGQVLIPPVVARELEHPPKRFVAVDPLQFPFIRIQSPQDRQRVRDLSDRSLDPGECEALALALEIGADAILIDEAKGRAVAHELGLVRIGALGVLLRAKQRGHVAEIRSLLDRLQRELGFFISDSLRHDILTQAGE